MHRTLSGLGVSYLDDLAPYVLDHFQTHLSGLLTKLDMNDSFANLLCLAVLAKFASRSPSAQTQALPRTRTLCPSGDTTPEETGAQFSHAQKYFVGKRATKTFDLAVLKAINACSSSSTLSLVEALETLTLSEEIVDALNIEDKRSRIKKNGAMIRNLHGKLLRSDINTSLQATVRIGETALD